MPAADEHPRPTWQHLIGLAQQWADRVSSHRTPPTSADGVAWNLLPIPWRFHRCWPQSWGSVGPFELVERCPCGGTRLNGEGRWLYRNRRVNENFGVGPYAGGENVSNRAIEPALMTEMREALREEPDENA